MIRIFEWQHLLIMMLEGECGGNRVVDITQKTSLSRPTVSHHMQILKDSKASEEVSKADGSVPEWFKKGVEASLLAPTAMNQQKYKFILEGNKVSAVCGKGFYTKNDLGITKYHFEIGAGKENFIWK